MSNWTNIDFKKTIKWYEKIRKSNKAKVKNVHLEKMKKWTYDKKKGFCIMIVENFFILREKELQIQIEKLITGISHL